MKNDIEQLKKYEPYFHSAINCDYIRALWDSDMKILISIYEKWTGTKYTGCMTCAKAKLTFMKKLGGLYYKNKELLMEQENGKDIERGPKEEGEVCKQVNSRGSQPKGGSRRSNKKV